MGVLYVSTFNKKLHDATGHRLVSSFNEFQKDQDCDLLVGIEGDSIGFTSLFECETTAFNLDRYDYLKNWTAHNTLYIPPAYGGTKVDWNEKDPNNSWNYRAAGWFRKLAAINYALDNKARPCGLTCQYHAIVFLDSDVYFKKCLPNSKLLETFRDKDFFYQLGPNRRRRNLSVESGIIGAKGDEGCFVLKTWIDYYNTDKWRDYGRWDDGWLLKICLEEHPEFKVHDIVRPHKEIEFSHVTRFSELGDYLWHDKGNHTRISKII
jgi:hypothetical protein